MPTKRTQRNLFKRGDPAHFFSANVCLGTQLIKLARFFLTQCTVKDHKGANGNSNGDGNVQPISVIMPPALGRVCRETTPSSTVTKAVTDFLDQHRLRCVMRTHQTLAKDVAIIKGARVFVVFSTLQDHNQGDAAMAGCILVDFKKMKVINHRAAYQHKYVHQRDSNTMQHLFSEEIDKCIDLGLIMNTNCNNDNDNKDYAKDNSQTQGGELQRLLCLSMLTHQAKLFAKKEVENDAQ